MYSYYTASLFAVIGCGQHAIRRHINHAVTKVNNHNVSVLHYALYAFVSSVTLVEYISME